MVELPPWLARLLSVASPLVKTGYRALAATASSYLRRGLPDASVYVAGTGASGELVAGLSDLDLVVVLGGDSAAVERDGDLVLARWRRLRSALPRLAPGLGISIYSERDLADADGGTALTYGLAAREASVDDSERGYPRPGRPSDELYRRLHPGIYGPGRTWRRVAAPHGRLPSRSGHPTIGGSPPGSSCSGGGVSRSPCARARTGRLRRISRSSSWPSR